MDSSDHWLRTVEDTWAYGEQLAPDLQAGDVLAMTGTLGAGKTQLCQGIARGLGATGDVTSPTFSLVHEYPGGRLPVFHFDFYRIRSTAELDDLGWDDYLERGGVVLVEWADLYRDYLPEEARWLRLSLDQENGGRRVRWMS